MRNLGLEIKDKLVLVGGITFILGCIALLIPFIPFILAYAYFDEKLFNKNYKLFLEKMNGECFFCYNSRKSSVDFARDVIVPELTSNVHVVFVKGREVEAGVDSKFISRMLYGVKEKKGFPYLLKIDQGQVLDMSVNSQFYSIMIGQKPTPPLLERISDFYLSASLASTT